MHVLRIYRRFPPLIGGIENHVYYLSRENLKRHELTLILPRMRYRSIKGKGKLRVESIPIKPLNAPQSYKKPSFFFHTIHFTLYWILSLISAINVTRKQKIDIIHLHGVWAEAILGFFLQNILRIPVVLTIHGSIRGGFSYLLPFPYKKIDLIIVVSSDIKMELRSLSIPSNKIVTISSGIATDIFNTILENPNNQVLLFVGRMRPMKGLEQLLLAIPHLRKQHKGIVLYVVGEGPSLSKCKKLSSKLELDNTVKFLGRKDHTQMGKIYKSANIFVMPSIYTNHEVEGTPTALLEAMYAGLPVVAFGVGGIREVVKNGVNGYIVKEKDISSLVRAISRILKSKKLMQKMGKESSRIAKEFTWPIIAKKIEKNFINLISKERKGIS